ncbi:MAG: hypothetical protein WD738_02115 [Pirellulales bacterium]
MIVDRMRNWKRFSLRSVFVLMTACCVFFGIWARYVNPYRMQARSLAEVKRLQGVFAESPAQGTGWQRWLVTTFLGEEAFTRVTYVDLSRRNVNDDALRSLAGLVYVEELKLDFTSITNDGLAALRSMRNLQRLWLRYTAVSDAAASYLETFPRLDTVFLTGTHMTDAAVDRLARLDSISDLHIRWTRISNEGAERLVAAMPNCAVHHHALQP